MTLEQEQKLKAMAALSESGTQTPVGLSGQLGGSYSDRPIRPGLIERIKIQKRRADEQSVIANRLGELEYLLDKNPEIARILELLDAVKE